MMSEIVVDNQDIPSLFHEVFCNACCRIRRDVDEAGRIIAFYDHHNGVVHRTLLVEVSHYFSHSGRALPNRTIDAHHILSALVEDRVDGDGSLAGLAIAENQFALATTDGNECVDRLQPGLQRNAHRHAIHDRCSSTFNGETLLRSDRALTVQRIAQGVYHASQQTVSHGDVHHTTSSLHFVACVQALVVPEQDDADLFFIEIECYAEQTSRECHDLLVTNAGETRECRDPGGDFCDHTHFMGSQHCREVRATPMQPREGPLYCGLQDSDRCSHLDPTGATGFGSGAFAVSGLGVGLIAGGDCASTRLLTFLLNSVR